MFSGTITIPNSDSPFCLCTPDTIKIAGTAVNTQSEANCLGVWQQCNLSLALSVMQLNFFGLFHWFLGVKPDSCPSSIQVAWEVTIRKWLSVFLNSVTIMQLSLQLLVLSLPSIRACTLLVCFAFLFVCLCFF